MPQTSPLYDRDFYAWAMEQADLLRTGKLSAADIEHIAEEIESMGRTEKRELVSRLTVLLMHMLKWQFQPDRRGSSWKATITVQRRALRRHLIDNPSLKASLPEAVADAHGDAILSAVAETSLSETTFPEICPWTFEQIMDEAFWPSESDRLQ